ncbi:MAG: Ig-like domain-containing protein [Candidatus Dormibacteria bacterium]
MPHLRPRWFLLLLAVLLAGCAPAVKPADGGRSSSVAAQPPKISITPTDGTTGVAPDSTLGVAASDGKLESVSIHPEGDPTPIPGTVSSDRLKWAAGTGLVPATKYVVNVAASNGNGSTTATSHFSTLDGQRLTTSPMPGDGSAVGVGMPIELRFNTPIPSELEARFISHVTVTSSPAVKGDWHWWGGSSVHWRPADFWAPGTKVTVSANLLGVNAGNGFWGFGNWSESFAIGERHITKIDNASHQMQVFKNDQLVATYPVSMGVDNHWPTIGGTLYVPYKIQDVQMDSLALTPPIPHGAPGGYFEHVYWDTAVSTDGFYIHSAPWSVGDQGARNVSHGCINLSEARATDFFNFSQIGDVVIIQGTPRQADQDDGEGDWQIPFAQYANSGGPQPPPLPSGGTGSGGL